MPPTPPGPPHPPINFKIDLAVVELSEQEKNEIIRERIREQDENREKTANSNGLFSRLRYNFFKEIDNRRDLINLRSKSDAEIFAASSDEFKKRKLARAEEISQLNAESLFNEVASTKGFKESIIDTTTGSIYKDRMVNLIKDYAKDLLSPTPPGPVLSRDVFERTKKQILTDMASGNAEIEKAVSSEFDNVWVKVEQVAERVRSLGHAASVVDAMNIDLKIKFGRARLNHETGDTESMSTRIENAILNCGVLANIPYEKRVWLIGGIIGAGNFLMSSTRGALGMTPFLGPLLSGVVSGGLEYWRKRDEVTYTNNRLTRMLAEGKDVSGIMQKQNPTEIARNISLVKVSQLKTQIEGLFSTYQASTTDKTTYSELLIADISKFRALLELSNTRGIDLLSSSTQDDLLKEKAELTKRCNEILNILSATHTETTVRNLFNNGFRNNLNIETTSLDNRTRQAAALRNNLSWASGARTGAMVGVASVLGSELISLTNADTQGAGEYLFGANQEARNNTSLNWAWKYLAGDESGLHEIIPGGTRVIPGVGKQLKVEFDENAFAGYETTYKTISVSGEEAYNQLQSKSDVIKDLARSYTGDYEAQAAKYGGHTRSLWESENSSVLNIYGRDRLDNLHDFSYKYLEAYKNGTFRAFVTLSNGEIVDVSKYLKLDNGIINLDLAQEKGVVGEIFSNGSNEGLKYIKNIQYGIGSGKNVDIVSTISGDGADFIPEGTDIKIPEVVKKFGRNVTTWVDNPDQVVTDPDRLGAQKGIDDLFLAYFGPRHNTETAREYDARRATTPSAPTPAGPTPAGPTATVTGTGPTPAGPTPAGPTTVTGTGPTPAGPTTASVDLTAADLGLTPEEQINEFFESFESLLTNPRTTKRTLEVSLGKIILKLQELGMDTAKSQVNNLYNSFRASTTFSPSDKSRLLDDLAVILEPYIGTRARSSIDFTTVDEAEERVNRLTAIEKAKFYGALGRELLRTPTFTDADKVRKMTEIYNNLFARRSGTPRRGGSGGTTI